MSKVAVTGANGFVGHHLVNELVGNGYDVLAIGGSNLPTGSANNPKVTTLTIDLSKPEEVASLDLSDVDAIVHLAGLAAVGPSFDDPMTYITTNVALEVNLFQRALQQSVTPRFVIISSGSLYDPKAPLPITEQTAVAPSSPYAVSKIAQEQMGHYYGNRGFDVVVARPFNHIGPGQNLGFLVPDIASQIVAYEKGNTDHILVGNLDAKRDYTDVRDIARAYRLLVEKGIAGETYNICSGASLSGHQILDRLLQEAGDQIPVQQDPARMRPSDAPDIYGSHQKITDDTGWEPQIDLATTLHDAIEDWRAR